MYFSVNKINYKENKESLTNLYGCTDETPEDKNIITLLDKNLLKCTLSDVKIRNSEKTENLKLVNKCNNMQVAK
ncbi:MAG: hypothetical protein ACK41T_03125 [Pseudobdellovibrio sp.]